jgi:hypothetical protein
MIIYIDMDDVLCDFTGAFNRAIEKFPQMTLRISAHRDSSFHSEPKIGHD